MATILFYEKPGCGNNARQKRLLTAAGHNVIARNLLTEPWSAERLREFFAALPVAEWFNRASPRIKSGAIVPEQIAPDVALALMLADPLLIRRPLMEADGRRITGFDAQQVEAWIGLRGAPEEEALQTCARKHACAVPDEPDAATIVFAYHERTKHHLARYAQGPETLDWSMQPNPFREFAGSPRIPLPLGAARLPTPFSRIYQANGIVPLPLAIESVGVLLELALGLSAWKEYGPDRWALRCNPSSGNLHPTEAYLLAQNIPGLENSLYHYVSREHVLEQRCRNPLGAAVGMPSLWIGLTSIHWREAWKYGERAFRYCQLDIGHALGALRYAAGALGWQIKLVRACGGKELASLLGLNRDQDFSGAEREDADLLLAVIPRPVSNDTLPEPGVPDTLESAQGIWTGQANVLDPHPMYRWPVIDEVAAATQHAPSAPEIEHADSYPPLADACATPAAAIILNRRSAQRFDAKFTMLAVDFYRMLDSLLARSRAPWDVWRYAPRIHPALFVHRVEGLAPGLYVLPRSAEAQAALRAAMRSEFLWEHVEHCPAHLPLFRLLPGACDKIARTMNCHQAIAADGCFALGMLAEFEPLVQAQPWRYRQLYWEAGLLGQVLYLEAEAAGLRGTGIGCFFDDAFHELLGLSGKHFQSLYHFTVGRALTDERISTQAPYPDHSTEK